MDTEPTPQFSIGFDFENPLADFEAEEAATVEFLFGLEFLSMATYDFDVQTSKTKDGLIQRSIYYPLHDGTIMITEFLKDTDGEPIVDERVISFMINDPDNPERRRCFDIVIAHLADGSLHGEVEDYGIDDDSVTDPEGELIGDAIELNVSARLDEVPDTVPQQRQDGTLRADIGFEEQFRAGNAAIQEVLSELDLSATRNRLPSQHTDPKRVLVLGRELVRKAIGVLEPVVFARLDADVKENEDGT